MTTQKKPIETYRGRVAFSECDHFGHMSMQFYVARISDATVTLGNAIGLTASYIRAQRQALVTVHQEISYLAPLKAGELVVMNSGLLSIEGNKLRFMHRMTRLEDGAPVMCAKVLMMGMDTERSTEVGLQEEILTRAQALMIDEVLA